jgi:hypothetical protein
MSAPDLTGDLAWALIAAGVVRAGLAALGVEALLLAIS